MILYISIVSNLCSLCYNIRGVYDGILESVKDLVIGSTALAVPLFLVSLFFC